MVNDFGLGLDGMSGLNRIALNRLILEESGSEKENYIEVEEKDIGSYKKKFYSLASSSPSLIAWAC